MIDQTTLVHDVISFLSSFEMWDMNDRESTPVDDECALDFNWTLVDPVKLSIPCLTEVIAKHDGVVWAGTPIAEAAY